MLVKLTKLLLYNIQPFKKTSAFSFLTPMSRTSEIQMSKFKNENISFHVNVYNYIIFIIYFTHLHSLIIKP